MMSIGDFAALSGLSIRALRFYDEQGVLVPAEVDEWSRYRRYSADQLVPAIRLNALRHAGIPLPEAARALTSPADTDDVIAAYRKQIAEERAKQDASLAVLDALWPDASGTATVEERPAEPCHWAGVVLTVGTDDADDDRGNQAFAAAWQSLTAAGNPPVGSPWSSVRATDNEESLDVLCCWPVAAPVATDWTVDGWEVVRGQVAEGPELVAHWPQDANLVEGSTHPAVVALLREAERRGTDVDLAAVRQIILGDETGEITGVEVAAPIAGRS